MSAGSPGSLDIEEQIVRIERNLAEIRKLQAEADKFKRDRLLAPVIAIASFVVAVASYLHH